MEVYDAIGTAYDITRQADPEIARRLRSHLQVPDGSSVIDVGCGTGNYTVALNRSGLQMTGVDVSEAMISKARQKSGEIRWICADAKAIPLPDGRFGGALIVLAIHHMNDRKQVFNEIHRVLDRGRLVIFTSSLEQMKGYWLNEYFPQAMEASRDQMPSIPLINSELKEARFTLIGTESFLVQPDLKDFFLYSGKYDPARYLDPKVRQGISTFAALANAAEVVEGCERLKADLESGRFEKVRNEYVSEQGDYCFIVAEKRR